MKCIERAAVDRRRASNWLNVFFNDRMSHIGPEHRLVRCSAMSGVEVKADSKSMASFGRC